MRMRLDGLRLQLLGLIILPFSLVLLAVALGGVQVHQQAMRRLVAERDERAVRSAAAALTEQLVHRQSAVAAMAQRVADGTSPDLVLSQASDLRVDFDQGLAVIDRDRRVRASTVPAEIWDSRPLAEVLAPLPDTPQFSSAFDEAGAPVVLVASGSGDTFVVGAFTTRMILVNTFLTSVGPNSQVGAFLVEGSGRLLDWQGTMPPPDIPSQHPGVMDALNGETGSAYYPASDGEHVVAFSPVPATGWALVTEEPWESVTSPMLDTSLMAPLVLIPALLIALLALWFGARQVIQPLRQLGQEAALLAEDPPASASRPVGGIAEIQDLQRTLISMAERVHTARASLRRYIGAITRAQEDERRRVARELHDETIQELIALDQRIQMLRMDLEAKGAPEAERAEAIHQSTTHAIEGVRRLTRALRPIYLEDLGLVPALAMLATDAERLMGIPVAFQRTGSESRLDQGSELAVYRIVQEALANVARHAHASHAWVEMDFGASELTCRVRDDGPGFAVPERSGDLADSGHFGLMGMRERADLVGAQLTIDSSPDPGTTVEVRLPYSAIQPDRQI
jgi:signal transduction histidine kinase